MPKRCLIYLRVSTAEQAGPGHHSLEAQEILCRRYAESQSHHVVEVLRDEGYSGRTTNRPGLRRLLEYTSPHPPSPIDTILVQDTSRMGRDTTEYLLFRRQLRERDIELVAVIQPNIDSSPEGRLIDTIMAGINQYQSEEKGRRVSIALQKKFEEGWWPAWAPLGYAHVEQEGKHRIEPDLRCFELVREAFDAYATGQYTQVGLLTVLTAKGLRNRQGGPLSRTSFNNLLANPFYWGLLCWHGQKNRGKHQPATDQSTWDRCQRVTALHNRYTARMRKHVFLLSGLTTCEACGNHHTHSVVAKKGNRYYHCKGAAHCSQPYIPEEELEGQVANLIQGIRLSDDFITRVVGKVKEVFEQHHAVGKDQVKVLLRRQAVVQQQREVAEQKLLSGVLTDEAYRRHLPRITDELDDLSLRLAEFESDRRLDTEALREILLFARDIPNAYAQAPPALQKTYLQFFFDQVVVRDKKITRAVHTELFQALLSGEQARLPDGQVRFSGEWLPSLNAIRTLIGLLKQPAWLEKQRKVMDGTLSTETRAA